MLEKGKLGFLGWSVIQPPWWSHPTALVKSSNRLGEVIQPPWWCRCWLLRSSWTTRPTPASMKSPVSVEKTAKTLKEVGVWFVMNYWYLIMKCWYISKSNGIGGPWNPLMKLFMGFCHARRHHRSATNGFKFRTALIHPRMKVDCTTPLRHLFLTGPKWTGFGDLGHLDVEWYTVYMYTLYTVYIYIQIDVCFPLAVWVFRMDFSAIHITCSVMISTLVAKPMGVLTWKNPR